MKREMLSRALAKLQQAEEERELLARQFRESSEAHTALGAQHAALTAELERERAAKQQAGSQEGAPRVETELEVAAAVVRDSVVHSQQEVLRELAQQAEKAVGDAHAAPDAGAAAGGGAAVMGGEDPGDRKSVV